ncbi:MAG: hypothetical protein JXQ82_06015 [Methanomicrobiaceae archaeon]|nr:hypothetical protein [Methanomicrobiaceae archaeon]
MLTLFKAMFKEEWRMHSTLFGNLNFALFPVLIFAIAFMGAFLLPLVHNMMDTFILSIVVHAQFLLMGVMVGSFGILGKEVMNRRFGQSSLIAYSARSLPVSERILFLNFVVKDILYYFILWVLPFCMGFLIAAPFINLSIFWPLLLFLTISLAFLTGLCVVFLLSSVYAVSKRALYLVLSLILVAFAVVSILYSPVFALSYLLLPANLFVSFSYSGLLISLLLIFVLFFLSVVFYSPYDTSSEKHYKNLLNSWSEKLSFLKDSTLVAKDFIDLYRSGIGIGQTIFSFILPLCLIWLVMSFVNQFLPQTGILFTLAVVSGVIASTIYTWLTEFDSISAYYFLPLRLSSVISAKAKTFTVLQAVPVIFLAVVAVISGGIGFFLNSVVLCLSVSFFELALMVRLCGLSPGTMIYNVRVFLVYILVTGPVILVLLGLTFISPALAYLSALMLIPAWLMMKSGFKKWDSEDFTGL